MPEVPSLLPGTEVVARGLRWEVVFAQGAGGQQLVRLRCLESSLRGQELEILSPAEPIEAVTTEFAPERAAPLPQWRLYHQAFLLEQALGGSAMLAAQPGRLRIEPYQLVPTMRALRMSRPRLLLADGVGLGKTIEAGLVLAELIARRRAHRVLIVCPAGPLLNQWKKEMRERFGLRFQVLDAGSLKEISYQNELGSNPFDFVSYGLTSIDFVKQERILRDLERCEFDVVIIDEAHHCVSLGKSGSEDDSLRRKLAEVLSQRCDSFLLLTATPHDGYDAHFASLVQLLDPSLVDGRSQLRGERYRDFVVRRLKRHITKIDPETGEKVPFFKERQVHPQRVSFTRGNHPQYAAFQELLLELVAPIIRRAVRRKRYDDVLAFVSLLKRSVSTVRACRNTLSTIADRLSELAEKGLEEHEERKQRFRTLRGFRRRLHRFGVLSPEEEEENAALEAEDMAAELAEATLEDLEQREDEARRAQRRSSDRLRQLRNLRDELRGLVDLAEQALPEDPKPPRIVELIQEIRAQEATANVLVYTEYTDSQDALVEGLEQALEEGDLEGTVLAIRGGDDRARTAAAERFTRESNLILVSTDAMAEGLNLHARCHHLIHLELPYNPNRLEQRNGRIDRYGQESEPQVHYLFLSRTFEERLLLRLVAKWEKQRARLSFVPDTLGVVPGTAARQGEQLLAGLAKDELRLFEEPAVSFEFGAAEDEDLDNPAYQELLDEVENVTSGFVKAAKTRDWLLEKGLNADEKQMEAAETARIHGERLGGVDLWSFTVNAVRSDLGSNAVEALDEATVGLRLTGNWTYGLEDVPGWDADERTLRLTSELEVTEDECGRSVGFLGRAHPIVRRALDRVRSIRFGTDDHGLDRRVSAARFAGAEPQLLLTFLGTIRSAAGREFERVIAVKLGDSGKPETMLDSAAWAELTASDRSIPTADVWSRHFSGWDVGAQERGQEAAEAALAGLAETFEAFHLATLADEERALEHWLSERTADLCGEADRQAQIFEEEETSIARWRMALPDVERLAAFGADGTGPVDKRREAQLALELYRKRVAELESRQDMKPAEVRPLGVLMLVPESDREVSDDA